MDLNYIIDKEGNQSAVIVPINQWENIMDRLAKMKKRLTLLPEFQKE